VRPVNGPSPEYPAQGEPVTSVWRRVAQAMRRLVGVPDYETYLAHMRRHHPDATPLSTDAFARDALARRYDRPGSRCC
jgi:uncharacterized short protein YbdD (DUF466 family)